MGFVIDCNVSMWCVLFITTQSMVEEFVSEVVSLSDENLRFLGMRLNFNHHYVRP